MKQRQLPKAAWVVTSGHAGHTLPCLGVLEAMGIDAILQKVAPKFPLNILAPWGPAFLSHELSQSPPPLVFASGRQAIPYARAIKKRSKGQSFVTIFQNPVVPPSWFDLVWVNNHDGLDGPNVIKTLTSANLMNKEKLRKEASRLAERLGDFVSKPLVGMILGGPSKAYPFGQSDQDQLRSMAQRVADSHDSNILIVPSRRTDVQFIEQMKATLPQDRVWIWDMSGDNPYIGSLGLCDRFVVTCDSVNMLGEAAFTGKPVYAFKLTGGGERITKFHNEMIDYGAMRWFEGRLEDWSYTPIDATKIIAEEIKKRFLSMNIADQTIQ